MPTTTKSGPSNHWLTLEPGYVAPQQAEEVPEVAEVAPEPEPEVQVKQSRKRVARADKAV